MSMAPALRIPENGSGIRILFSLQAPAGRIPDQDVWHKTCILISSASCGWKITRQRGGEAVCVQLKAQGTAFGELFAELQSVSPTRTHGREIACRSRGSFDRHAGGSQDPMRVGPFNQELRDWGEGRKNGHRQTGKLVDAVAMDGRELATTSIVAFIWRHMAVSAKGLPTRMSQIVAWDLLPGQLCGDRNGRSLRGHGARTTARKLFKDGPPYPALFLHRSHSVGRALADSVRNQKAAQKPRQRFRVGDKQKGMSFPPLSNVDAKANPPEDLRESGIAHCFGYGVVWGMLEVLVLERLGQSLAEEAPLVPQYEENLVVAEHVNLAQLAASDRVSPGWLDQADSTGTQIDRQPFGEVGRDRSRYPGVLWTCSKFGNWAEYRLNKPDDLTERTHDVFRVLYFTKLPSGVNLQ
ncbi:hypothetical protein BC832DRAFT_541583 [Gaertneriomyces semiglobifer]|nr:hypothetical protein BC832DRAFT_541583 [Gaertneriomyces semiglobifer]